MSFKAKTVRVIDGDTYDFLLDLGLDVHKRERIRLRFFDAPETRGEHKVEGMFYKELAHRALAKGKNVWVVTYGKGKYGRRLADVFIDGVNIIDAMIEEQSIPPLPEVAQ